ncbi:DUF4136 domain-containing protein [Microbulbifer sp. OS29]|uniref:DUF4136 domain-containing protein n=1 Tax=Microbulbifer okhotskensis TaxID=2926617 RepID=A0A9X2EKJ0_9GAMM|nr:DUF4136 domain-containing protein [Microbulbifer okhotskensis]MCO1333356.1 DUF4136 domain-containing protein [Microbulbifer okhotskensis]
MRYLFTGLFGLLLLAGCQEIQVERAVPGAPPVAFSTYKWGVAPLSGTPDASAQLVELDEEMRDTVAAEMQERGYRQVTQEQDADMVVDYQVAVVDEFFSGDTRDPSWDKQFDSNAPQDVVELPPLTDAPLVIMSVGIGRPGGAIIWGGRASELLTRPDSIEQRQRLIANGVNELLRDLPPAYQ